MQDSQIDRRESLRLLKLREYFRNLTLGTDTENVLTFS